ncbi:MAG TPA: hypothetical protein VEB86_10710 [Chryseosolibacter sp.]|nr:hypothetical protein [Chryseosolibacter sp.]
MKKIVLIGGMIMITAVLAVAGLRTLHSFGKTQLRKGCVGFTVIEAGKGINCHGDTIRLSKKSGYYTAEISTKE